MAGLAHPAPEQPGGVTLDLPDEAATRALGAALGATAEPGDIIVLDGPLGAGKTVLAAGLGAGLGVSERITSPTFVLARVHRSGRLPLVHADLYRLADAADPLGELDDLDLLADAEVGVLVVEWGRGLVATAVDQLLVELRRPIGELRTARLSSSGSRFDERIRVVTGS